jgi:hypothetical protein
LILLQAQEIEVECMKEPEEAMTVPIAVERVLLEAMRVPLEVAKMPLEAVRVL